MSLLGLLKRRVSGDDPVRSATTPASSTDAVATIISDIASLAQQQRYAEACNLANDALREAPDHTGLLFAKGSTLLDWGRFGEARDVYADAERKGLRSVALYRHLGWSCFHAGDVEAAERHLRQGVLVDGEDFDACFCLGIVLAAREASDEAATIFARAVALRPGDFQANLMLGNSKLHQKDAIGAEDCYRRAAALNPTSVAAWVNLGTALREQDKLVDAIGAFEKAHELEEGNDKSDVDAFLSVALGYADTGRIREALDLLETHLAQRPSVQAHCNYATHLLQEGRLRDGWHYFEFRWMLDEKGFERPAYGKPAWTGQDLNGKTILIRAEQGIGDTIQFLRYAGLLKSRGARVLLKAPPGLEQLSANIAGLDAILPSHETPLDFDFYVHSMSLGRAFGTTLETIPAPVPYVAADPERKARWRVRLGDHTGVKIGLVWAGSPGHKRDRYRSIPYKSLEPLLELAGPQFISLQKGPAAEQLEDGSLPAGILNLGPELDDLADTAAVIDNLDLIIGVDTAVLHLAGAMGRPVWALIPTPPDWRWMLERADTPWYPTMRLFRQQTRGDWVSVVARVKEELGKLLSGANDRTIGAAPTVPKSNSAHSPGTDGSSARATPDFGGVAETRYGIVHYLATPTAQAKSLHLYGEYLQSEIEILRHFTASHRLVLEVGAGIGAHTLALADHCKGVIAYEADLIRRRVLRQNLRANRVKNVTVLPTDALDHRDGAKHPGDRYLRVDDLALTQPFILKINEQGCIADTVAGAEDALWRLRPIVFASVNDRQQCLEWRERVARFGLRAWRITIPLFRKENFNQREENELAGLVAIALLAAPEECEVDLPAICEEIR